MTQLIEPRFNTKGILLNTQDFISDIQSYAKQLADKLNIDLPIVNLSNPSSLYDKVYWLLLNDCSLLKSMCEDTLLIKEYAQYKTGSEKSPKTIATYNTPQDIEWDSLPDKYIIKCNNCNMSYNVPDKKLLSDTQKQNIILQFDLALNSTPPPYEPQKYNICGKIYIEEYIIEDDLDYFIYTFNYSQSAVWCTENETDIKISSEMLEYAKKLSCDFPFAGIQLTYTGHDFYLKKLYFTPDVHFYRCVTSGKNITIPAENSILKYYADKMVNLCIIHYNTPYMTECLIKSINKFVPKCNIYVFDNSDKYPFTYRQDNITIFDNTKGQLLNFESELKKYAGFTYKAHEQYISAKHAMSVEKCMSLINSDFILMDSDILLKRDISDIIDENTIFTGEISVNRPLRVLPYLCYINTNMCRKYGIHFFDPSRILVLSPYFNSNRLMDTGGSFYADAKQYKLPYKTFILDDYIIHYKGASWDVKGICAPINRKGVTPEMWLETNSNYYL